MLIRITKVAPGCIMQPGQLIRVGDRRGWRLIEDGYAVACEDKPKPPTRNPRITYYSSPYMMPPRFICGCGMVFDDEESLKKHKAECC